MTWRLMNGHTCIAIFTIGEPATIMAFERWGIAPAIDKDQNLIARSYFRGNGAECFLREARHKGEATNIQRLNLRRLGVSGSLGEAQVLIAPLLCIAESFERRGRRAEHQRNFQAVGAYYGEIACRITKTILLFE